MCNVHGCESVEHILGIDFLLNQQSQKEHFQAYDTRKHSCKGSIFNFSYFSSLIRV